MSEILENNNELLITEKKHNKIKIWLIILNVLSFISLGVSIFYFINFVTADNLGKAVLLTLLLLAPVLCLLNSAVTLIVSCVCYKKLKFAKISTYINTGILLIQIVLFVLLFVLV